MQEEHLQDRIYWGMNRAANVLGRETDVYRPEGTVEPLARTNRYIRLRAAFSREDGNFARSVGYGVATWRGYFDASYTRVGDYLVQGKDVWFIIAQHAMLPVLCVKTNHVITIRRQISPSNVAPDHFGSTGTAMTVISGWPASSLGISTDGKSPARLPGDTAVPNVTTLLPSVHNQTVRPTDLVVDEYGTASIVVAAELSELGLRLNVRHVST